ncbi:ATP-binding cassette domain-containing protein, partial [Enterobacter hormaechei]|uniref:ATP-binding cassette domain-containing protein n=1 Tax=Enterobacter hormaechei TaxID=158836 RepID=UPI003CC55F9C
MPHREELDNCEVLAVHQLNIAFQEERQFIPAVQNLSFSLRRGETLAIVGESGSGKSVTALALMRLLEQTGGQVTSERMLLRRRNRQVIDLNELSASQMQADRFGNLLAHRKNRVQGGHRLLKNHRNICPAHPLHLGRTQLVEIDNLTVATAQQHPLA